jgi:hypothetical protein
MAQIALLHDRLMVTVLLYMLALAAWGLFNYIGGQGISGSYGGALVVGELLLLAEALLGVALLFAGAQPSRFGIHILYGLVAVLCLPGAFAYTRGRDSRWENLVYATVCLFLAGIAIRARQTGGL